MNLDTTQLVGVLATVTPFVVAIAKYAYDVLLTRLPSSRAQHLQSIVDVVVSGVEQSSANSQMSNTAKKALAVKAIVDIAARVGLGRFINPTLVDMLVEAAVYQLPHTAPVASQTGSVSSSYQTVAAL